MSANGGAEDAHSPDGAAVTGLDKPANSPRAEGNPLNLGEFVLSANSDLETENERARACEVTHKPFVLLWSPRR